MPHVEAGLIERRLHTHDFARKRDDRVFETGFPCLRRSHLTGRNRLPLDDLEHDLVYVDRVRVLGEIVERPDLSGPHGRVLSYHVLPPDGSTGAIGIERAENGCGRTEGNSLGTLAAELNDTLATSRNDPHGCGVQLVQRQIARVTRRRQRFSPRQYQ
jgi:hypothetical protein